MMVTTRRTLLFGSALVLSALPTWSQGGSVEFRSIDGFGNNFLNPTWGSTMSPLRRAMLVDYADGLSTPSGDQRASARAVSNLVASQPGDLPNSIGASDMVWQWGQFLDHDIDLTENHNPAEAFHIEVPLGDPQFDPFNTGTQLIPLNRSLYDPLSILPWREQLNQITAFIDASNVYGSDPVRAEALRLPSGQMRVSAGLMLPFNTQGFPNAPDSSPGFFLAGDVRANEQLGLTAMHTLFVREHNRQARRLFLTSTTDPTLVYEGARRIVSAEMQAITYNEFLPVLLGPNAIPPYTGYNPKLDPSIRNEFSTACYRFGHSMLSATLKRLDANLAPIADGDIALKDAFFNPQELIDEGIEPLLRGLTVQVAQEIDVHVVDDVRNFLFGPPGSGGFDLASLNIQRGRDHGLPSYNQARLDMGLPAKASFAEVSSDPATANALAAAYATVDDIDLWVGGLAEDHVPGALVGELVHKVLVDQFTRLRDGDRFWYENVMTPSEQVYVNNHTLTNIMRRSTPIGFEVDDNPFLVPGS